MYLADITSLWPQGHLEEGAPSPTPKVPQQNNPRTQDGQNMKATNR